MMWISVSRIHILSILAVVFSAGCTTFDNASRHRQHYWDYEDHVDLSDLSASGVVTIGGSTRTLLGLFGQYCWIESPAKAKRVTVNAGMVDTPHIRIVGRPPIFLISRIWAGARKAALRVDLPFC